MRTTGLVLLYHRIAALAPDSQRLCVSPENFSRHLSVLAARYRPMSLSQLMDGAQRGVLPDRAVAITFDDGYADNFHTARPLLERFNVPATIFVTSGQLGSDREFWWDELERLLLQPGVLPEILELRVGRTMARLNLHGAGAYDADTASRYRDWNVERRDNPTSRHEVYRKLFRIMRPLPCDERHATLDALGDAAACARPPHAAGRALRPDELRGLLESGLFDVGAHTVTHPVLAELSVDGQKAEIAGSRVALRTITGRDVRYFAYPFGARGDYTRVTEQLVRAAGFEGAYSTHPGMVQQRSDPFHLPRVLVRNWNEEDFVARLEAWS